jgi:hypothetical protein
MKGGDDAAPREESVMTPTDFIAAVAATGSKATHLGDACKGDTLHGYNVVASGRVFLIETPKRKMDDVLCSVIPEDIEPMLQDLKPTNIDRAFVIFEGGL